MAGQVLRSEFQTLADIMRMLHPDSASAAEMPGDRAHEFNQQQLGNGGQLPQYDPQGGVATALGLAQWLPGAGGIKAFGFYPDGRGGFLPSMKEDLENGRPIDALRDAFGIAGPAYKAAGRATRFFDIKQPAKK
jgi:hypothetical protein